MSVLWKYAYEKYNYTTLENTRVVILFRLPGLRDIFISGTLNFDRKLVSIILVKVFLTYHAALKGLARS